MSAADWLPEGHLAYFIADTVEALDLSAFHARYAKGGPRNQPFHAQMMVKVLLYGYATGVFSSRKLATRLHDDVAFRVLAADNLPVHRTLSDLRALHLAELSALLMQSMSYARIVQAEAELKQQIADLLERARAADLAEANAPEQDLPAEIARREQRLAAIEAAKARLEAQQREADTARGRHDGDERKPRHPDGTPKRGKPFERDFGVPEDAAQTSFTDPESRIMKQSNGGFEHSYNAQTAVDAERRIIIAAELTACAADSGELPSMVEAVERTVGALPQTVLADAGYRSEAALAALAETPLEVIVALGREGREQAQVDAGKYPHTAQMAERLKSQESQAAYRRCKAIVKAPNGWIKSVLGLRQFSLRGLEKVRAEWRLVCLAMNLRRMAARA